MPAKSIFSEYFGYGLQIIHIKEKQAPQESEHHSSEGAHEPLIVWD